MSLCLLLSPVGNWDFDGASWTTSGFVSSLPLAAGDLVYDDLRGRAVHFFRTTTSEWRLARTPSWS